MKEKCFIDTTVILKIILEGDVEVLRGLSEYYVCTSLNVLEEATFKIIVSSVLETMGVERASIYKIKDEFEKGTGRDLILKRLHAINFLKSSLIVLPLDDNIFESSKEVIKKYDLLPNDALIVATCKHYGIRKIATFDGDFKRVDFLEILGDEI
jgi:predicted nucleic acid-binding protein